MRTSDVFLTLMVFQMLTVVLLMPTVEGDVEEKNRRSLTSMWTSLYNWLQSDPRAAACFMMRYRSPDCVKVYANDVSKRQVITDDNNDGDSSSSADDVLCQGRPCNSKPSRPMFDRDEPYTGPKRFYNNW